MMTRLTLFYDSIGKEVYTNQSILDSKHDLAARERERERERNRCWLQKKEQHANELQLWVQGRTGIKHNDGYQEPSY